MKLAEMEAEAFLLGIWKNFDELEENITIDELAAILEASRNKDKHDKEFAAALKGIDLKSNSDDEHDDNISPYERAVRKAKAIASGMGEEEYEFAELGFGVEEEEE